MFWAVVKFACNKISRHLRNTIHLGRCFKITLRVLLKIYIRNIIVLPIHYLLFFYANTSRFWTLNGS